MLPLNEKQIDDVLHHTSLRGGGGLSIEYQNKVHVAYYLHARLSLSLSLCVGDGVRKKQHGRFTDYTPGL